MQTAIEPVVVPQIIEIPASEQEKRLNRMIQLVKDGWWCRDFTNCPYTQRHCALGLVSRVARGDV